MVSDETRIDMPKKLYNRIEKDVVKLHLDLELTIPIKPIEVAERLGFVVKKFSDIACEDNNMMSEFRVGNDGKRRDGLSYYDPKIQTFIILVNDMDTFYKEHDEFTVMHEIGHIRMGNKEDSQLAEKIANYYASYALVPSPLPGLYNCSTYIDIFDRFKVSMDCAIYSLNRCINWTKYCHGDKEYERKLVAYYKRIIDGGNAYDCIK